MALLTMKGLNHSMWHQPHKNIVHSGPYILTNIHNKNEREGIQRDLTLGLQDKTKKDDHSPFKNTKQP